MTVIQKGYGVVKVVEGGEVVEGEVTLYGEGWVAAAPVSHEDNGESRWFPNDQIAELVWRKSIATRRPG